MSEDNLLYRVVWGDIEHSEHSVYPCLDTCEKESEKALGTETFGFGWHETPGEAYEFALQNLQECIDHRKNRLALLGERVAIVRKQMAMGYDKILEPPKPEAELVEEPFEYMVSRRLEDIASRLSVMSERIDRVQQVADEARSKSLKVRSFSEQAKRYREQMTEMEDRLEKVEGVAVGPVDHVDWFARAQKRWDHLDAKLDSLREKVDVVIQAAPVDKPELL